MNEIRRTRNKAVVAMYPPLLPYWGEDLILGLLKHFWLRRENCKSEILQGTPKALKTNGEKGYWLDAWILKSQSKHKCTLFQVEVKNWSAFSIDGVPLEYAVSSEKLRKYSDVYRDWFKKGFLQSPSAKVMKKMKKPENYENHRSIPLLGIWPYMVDRHGAPYSVMSCSNASKVHVFSASAYLRSLTGKYVEIEMPRAKRRVGLMKGLTS